MNYIKYKKQDLPLVIDFSVIKKATAKLNLKLSEFEKAIDNPTDTETIAFLALERGHKLEGKPFEIKAEEIEDVLSESYGQFLKAFSEDVLKMFSIEKKSEQKTDKKK